MTFNSSNIDIIRVNNLKKDYGLFSAVNGLSFTVHKGEIFGFLGPNGAGKTTTIKILSTLSLPTGGTVYVNGYNVVTQSSQVRHSIGLVFQESTLDNHLTAEENLFLHAMLYDVSYKTFLQRKREVLKLCELWDKRKHLVDTFSGGMKRRLEIARALIHFPKVLFLDEPTVGLDPQTRNKIWDYITTVQQRNKMTIFLTTQYINEAENCDRVAIIDHGKIIALDTPDNLKKMVGGDIIIIKTTDNQRAIKELHIRFPQVGIKIINKEIQIETERGDEFIPLLVKAVTPRITSLILRRPTLEDVFLTITGRKIREDSTDKIKEEENSFDLSSIFSLFAPPLESPTPEDIDNTSPNSPSDNHSDSSLHQDQQQNLPLQSDE